MKLALLEIPNNGDAVELPKGSELKQLITRRISANGQTNTLVYAVVATYAD